MHLSLFLDDLFKSFLFRLYIYEENAFLKYEKILAFLRTTKERS